jgi:hypothetical protein
VTGLLSPAARRSYYANTLAAFCAADRDVIFAQMARQNDFDLTGTQRHAWLEQAAILQTVLAPYTGSIYLEFTIPRMGRRIDRASTGTRIGPWSFAWWGEGRKLNTGEAGISEWLAALDRSFPASAESLKRSAIASTYHSNQSFIWQPPCARSAASVSRVW